MQIHIEELAGASLAAALPELAGLLEACVSSGASIGFVLPLAPRELELYWAGVQAAVDGGAKRLLAACADNRLAGSVQLALEQRANGSHRAEVQKLLVAPWARRQGIGESLMREAEALAQAAGRTLLVLDTRVNDDAQRLYTRMGYGLAGVIPHYARSPDGATLDGSAFMYKWIGTQPPS